MRWQRLNGAWPKIGGAHNIHLDVNRWLGWGILMGEIGWEVGMNSKCLPIFLFSYLVHQKGLEWNTACSHWGRGRRQGWTGQRDLWMPENQNTRISRWLTLNFVGPGLMHKHKKPQYLTCVSYRWLKEVVVVCISDSLFDEGMWSWITIIIWIYRQNMIHHRGSYTHKVFNTIQ